MQRDINTVTLTGRLTKEPKFYQAGKAVYPLLRVTVHAGKRKRQQGSADDLRGRQGLERLPAGPAPNT